MSSPSPNQKPRSGEQRRPVADGSARGDRTTTRRQKPQPGGSEATKDGSPNPTNKGKRPNPANSNRPSQVTSNRPNPANKDSRPEAANKQGEEGAGLSVRRRGSGDPNVQGANHLQPPPRGELSERSRRPPPRQGSGSLAKGAAADTTKTAAPAKPLWERFCPFCPIAADPDKEAVTAVYHGPWDGNFVAFQPMNPVCEGHTLVIPRKHVQDAVADPKIFGATCACAAQVARTKFKGRDMNILTNVGLLAEQSVPHLHVHIVPREEADGLLCPWTGQLPNHYNTSGKPELPDHAKPRKKASQ